MCESRGRRESDFRVNESDADGGECVADPRRVVALRELLEHKLLDKSGKSLLQNVLAHIVHESLLEGEVVKGEEL